MSRSNYKSIWIFAQSRGNGTQHISVGQGDDFEKGVFMSYTFKSAFVIKYVAFSAYGHFNTVKWKLTNGKKLIYFKTSLNILI